MNEKDGFPEKNRGFFVLTRNSVHDKKFHNRGRCALLWLAVDGALETL